MEMRTRGASDMNNHRQRADMRRIDNASDKPLSTMAHRQSQLPGRNCEQLIRQFQSIDGSTRTDAEQQIDAYERSFLSIFESSPITGAMQGNAKEAIKRPPYPDAASP
jgi:hypothetical protein